MVVSALIATGLFGLEQPRTHQAHAFATLPSSTASYVDGVTFELTGTYLLLCTRGPSYALTILDRTGNVVQQVAMGDENTYTYGTNRLPPVTHQLRQALRRDHRPRNQHHPGRPYM